MRAAPPPSTASACSISARTARHRPHHAPQLAFTLPGITLICGDSHTSSSGGVGALALGSAHPGGARDGHPNPDPGQAEDECVTTSRASWAEVCRQGHGAAYDRKIGAAAPPDMRSNMPARRSVATDRGSHHDLQSLDRIRRPNWRRRPDETTFHYLENDRFAPQGGSGSGDGTMEHLSPMKDALFDTDKDVKWTMLRADHLGHQSGGRHCHRQGIPVPRRRSGGSAQAVARRWTIINLPPACGWRGTKVDLVFIGSCTNSRLSDLRAAAALAAAISSGQGRAAWWCPARWKGQTRRGGGGTGPDLP